MKYLFPTYGGGHVRSVIPVISKLIDLGHEVIVIALTTSVKDLKKENIPYYTVDDLMFLYENHEKDNIFSLGSRFSSHYSSSTLDEKETISYLGMNLYCLTLEYGEEQAIYKYENGGRNAFLPMDFSLRVIDHFIPDTILVTCGQRTEKAIALAANTCKVNVFRLVDLLGDKYSIGYDCNVLAMNSLAANNIKEFNPNIEKIYVTGNPNFDVVDVFSEVTEIKNRVTIFTQPGVVDEKTISYINQVAFSLKNFEFFIKIHPSEEVESYACIDNRYVSVLGNEEDTVRILRQSEYVLTFFSSVGFQAINLDKKLYILNFSNKVYPIDFVGLGVAEQICSLQDFLDIFSTIYNNKVNVDKISIVKQPGGSVQSIIDVLTSENNDELGGC